MQDTLKKYSALSKLKEDAKLSLEEIEEIYNGNVLSIAKESYELNNDGHSGARFYKIKLNDKYYFLKIKNEKMKDTTFNEVMEITKVYESLSIKALQLFGFGFNKEYFYYIYNYIDGENLRKIKDKDVSYFYKAGLFCGKELRKVKTAKFETNYLEHVKDIEEANEYILKLYKEILCNKEASKLIEKYFGKFKMDNLITEFLDNSKVFKRLNKKLIHADIKRSNFILDKMNNIWIADIESMHYDYEIFNERYQMTWIFMPDNENEQYFIKGFNNGFYNYKKPKSFNKQIKYMYIFNLIENTAVKVKNNQFQKADIYLKNTSNVLKNFNEHLQKII